jgi:Ca2+-binding RTX toxin-like protein
MQAARSLLIYCGAMTTKMVSMAADTLIGGAGGDFFGAGAGNDSIDGGANGDLGQRDTLSYQYDDATSGITVTFTSENAGTVNDWSGGTDTFTGIEYIRGTHFADTLIGAEGSQQFRANGGDDMIDGGAGQDILDYRDTGGGDEIPTGPVVVNMVTGTASDGFGGTDTFTNIEDIRGSEYNDSLLGNDGDNEIEGNAGNDTIDGGLGRNHLSGGQGNDAIISRSGRDAIEGGAGDDTITVYDSENEQPYIDPGLGSDTIIAVGDVEISLSYRSLDQGVQIDLALGQTLKQGGAVDTFGIVEQVTGSFGNDTILGSDRQYEAYEASFGSDVIDGRGGFDELRFIDEQETGVIVDMAAGTATGSFSTLVTFSNIESIQGSRGADSVAGSNAEYEQFRMLGGNDTIDGGAGIDRVDYSSDQFFGGNGVGVTVDLAAGTATDALGDTDTLTSIEEAAGTDWADVLSGSAEDNWLLGNSGNDTLNGREGVDVLVGDEDSDLLDGGTGGDFLTGGADLDTLTGGADDDVFRGTIAELNGDTITDLAAGERIWVVDDNGVGVGANITTDGTSIFIDTTGDGVAEAVMVNGNGFTGPIGSYAGPAGGGPQVAARITLDGNASILATVNEGDSGTTTITATVRRSGDLASSVTVTYDVAGFGASPANAADLAAGFGAGNVTFAAGQTEAQITLQVQGDLTREATETLRLVLTGATGTGALPVDLVASEGYARILNDDFLSRVSISGQKVQEDSGSLTFTVTRDGADLSQPLTVSYSLSGGDGLRDADPDDVVGGLPQTGTVTFAAGQSVATITLGVIADQVSEFHERVVAQITGLGGAGAASHEIGTAQAVGEIRNDDGVPSFTGIGFIPPASSYADPHLITFDGLAYDFQTVGEFTLVEAVSGDPLSVQVRYSAVPGSDLASQTTAVATDLGGVRVVYDATSADPLKVVGVAVDLASVAGGVDVGNGQVYFDGEALTVVYASGEQMRVDIFDGFLNVSLSVLEGHAMRGLLGSNDGNSANDLALRDGTVLAQPVAFEDLYGVFADDWRITDATSLFDYAAGENTETFTDRSFPAGVLELDDVPDALLDQATAAAAGISDPILREAAIRDFIMSGNADYFDAANAVSTAPTETLELTGAPEIARGIGAYASDSTIIEGDDGATTLVYTVYRTGDLTQSDNLTYQISGATSTLVSGAIAFAAGEAAKSVSIDIAGDRLVEADVEIVFSFQPVSAGALILNSRVVTDLVDDDGAPIARNDAFTGDEDSLLIGNVLSDNGQGVDSGDGTLQITALLAPDGTQLGLGQTHEFDFGKVTLAAEGSFTYDPRGSAFDDLAAGQTEQVQFGYVLSDGVNSDIGYVDITVTGVDERPDFNEITGTNRNDFLRGTRGDDLIAGLGGNDVMTGRSGEDWFVFNDETVNCRRETDIIFGFDQNEDAIVLGPDAEIRSIRDTWDGVRITFEGDRDALRIVGHNLDADKIAVLHIDDLNFV